MNTLVGVFGAKDPAEAMRRIDIEASWADDHLAVGGAAVWRDRSGRWLLAGEHLLDNAEELERELAMPGADPGALLVELIARDGPDGMKRALGLIAAVAYDTQERRILLARDALGARTLYYAGGREGWWFATRLSTVRLTPAVSGRLSMAALRDYLTCAFVPGRQTLYRDVREVRPGAVVELPADRAKVYWEPSDGASLPGDVEDHAHTLRTLLELAVLTRLPEGGPTAVFLSGGLDSSLVTALAAREAPGAVHTFSIHFGPEHPNELEFSSMVARHCGTTHHVLELPARVIRDRLERTLEALDDPIGDPLTVPNDLLAQAAGQHAPVILNGEGGDPCFGGPKNLPMLLHEVYGSAEERERAYLRSYQKCYDDLEELLTPEVKEELSHEPPQERLLAPFFGPHGMSDYVHRLMHVNVRLKGADHILTKVNNLSTEHNLLARSPLFDRRIVDFAFSIPAHHKLDGANEKAVLKRAVADLLPEPVLTRQKSGMLVPVQAWFQRDLRRYARAMLLDKRARTRPYLNRDVVDAWLDYRGSLWPRHGVKLWLLLTLEVWLRAHEG